MNIIGTKVYPMYIHISILCREQINQKDMRMNLRINMSYLSSASPVGIWGVMDPNDPPHPDLLAITQLATSLKIGFCLFIHKHKEAYSSFGEFANVAWLLYIIESRCIS